jgi:hypothetical protein
MFIPCRPCFPYDLLTYKLEKSRSQCFKRPLLPLDTVFQEDLLDVCPGPGLTMSLLVQPSRFLAVRALSTSAWMARKDMGGNEGKNPFGDNIPAKFKKLKELQAEFNVDNGKRVHERGKTDNVLHSITVLILAVGFAEWCRVWWTLAYPNGFK